MSGVWGPSVGTALRALLGAPARADGGGDGGRAGRGRGPAGAAGGGWG
eukprot:COSAG01_NODE_6433_length_3669_cov_61.729412_5_plen_47_part_01